MRNITNYCNDRSCTSLVILILTSDDVPLAVSDENKAALNWYLSKSVFFRLKMKIKHWYQPVLNTTHLYQLVSTDTGPKPPNPYTHTKQRTWSKGIDEQEALLETQEIRSLRMFKRMEREWTGSTGEEWEEEERSKTGGKEEIVSGGGDLPFLSLYHHCH